MPKEALFYEKIDNQKVICRLCPRQCTIEDGKTGFCLNRWNKNGILYSLNYGKVSAINIDPVEKKPLYHFFPGKPILSFGSWGCSLHCDFCQNYTIARNKAPLEDRIILPNECIQIAQQEKQKLIAYTYNEPFVWYEHVLETATLAKENGFYNVLVTNGYYEKKPWKKLISLIDAMNIDLKGDRDFYQKICLGNIEKVIEIIQEAIENQIHIEITHLVVPHEKESMTVFETVLEKVVSLSRNIPFHISRYFPRYRRNEPPTDKTILQEMYTIASQSLSYVYLGNIESNASHTFCPQCKNCLIERNGYQVNISKNFQRGICGFCQNKIYGIFE